MARDWKGRTGLSKEQIRGIRASILFEQDFVCAKCGNTIEYKPRSACLHHIDGDPNHNHRSNLLVLCPKCHKFPHGYDKRKRNWLKRVREQYGEKTANKCLRQSEQRKSEQRR